MDVTGAPESSLRDRDSNPGRIDIACGGVARNVAENLARLGVDSRLLTLLGNDQYGEMILALGGVAGIDMQYVQQLDSDATSMYLAVLDHAGDMEIAIADMEIMNQLTPDWLQQYRHALGGAAVIAVDANLPAATLEWIASTFKDCTIVADTVSSLKAPALAPVIGALNTLKTSAIEANALTGRPSGSEDELHAIADELHGQGLERLFVTLGDQGVFYSAAGERALLPPLRQPDSVRNSSGAGDAFLAGLIYAWLQEWPLADSVRFSLAAAEVTVSDHATSSSALSLTAINRILEQ